MSLTLAGAGSMDQVILDHEQGSRTSMANPTHTFYRGRRLIRVSTEWLMTNKH